MKHSGGRRQINKKEQEKGDFYITWKILPFWRTYCSVCKSKLGLGKRPCYYWMFTFHKCQELRSREIAKIIIPGWLPWNSLAIQQFNLCGTRVHWDWEKMNYLQLCQNNRQSTSNTLERVTECNWPLHYNNKFMLTVLYLSSLQKMRRHHRMTVSGYQNKSAFYCHRYKEPFQWHWKNLYTEYHLYPHTYISTDNERREQEHITWPLLTCTRYMTRELTINVEKRLYNIQL